MGKLRHCEVYSDCGGCSRLDIPYKRQLELKREMVRENIAAADEDPDTVDEVVGAENPWRYRNKLDLTFSPQGQLGFHKKGYFNRYVPVNKCLLGSCQMDKVIQITQDWALKWEFEGFHKQKHTGLLRHLMLRESAKTGDLMVVLYTHRGAENDGFSTALDDWVQRLLAGEAQIGPIMWGRNPRVGDVADAPEEEVSQLWGEEYLAEELAGYNFRIYRETFFQINHVQAERLVQLTRKMAAAEECSLVMDLYSGIGTLSLPLADDAEDGLLVGVEINDQATLAARKNAERNRVENVRFITDNVRLGIPKVREDYAGSADLVILDPPRSGAGGKVMRKIGRTQAERVVYVSCNPESFARDLEEILPFRYRLEKVTPLDMFPHTEHVEIVAQLQHHNV